MYGSDKYDRILQRKPYPPGKDPRARLGKPSAYAQQLTEKQKMRDIYGLSEKQFRRVYSMSASANGRTGDVMRQILERRLDNAIYRAGFAMTRLQARQFVSHGLFLVDGVRVTCPSFNVKEGQKISIRPRSKTSSVFGPILSAHEKYMPPSWLKVNAGSLEAEVTSIPVPDDAEQGLDVQQVVEYYSRN